MYDDIEVPPIYTNIFIVKFKMGMDITRDLNIILGNGVLIHTYHSTNSVAVIIDDISIIDVLRMLPTVESINPESTVHIAGVICVGAEEPIPRGVAYVRAPEVHQIGNKGAGIKVCVHDTGIDYNHPDLKNNYKGGYNFVGNNNNPMDDMGHGSHVAGTISANGSIIGVAPEAYLYGVKALDSTGSGTGSGVIAGIQWAIDNHMDIINMSWTITGGTGSDIYNILQEAYNAGILLVAAAGNHNPSDPNPGVGMPASYEFVMGAGALDSNYNKALFSNYGPETDVSAPGTMILSTASRDTRATIGCQTGYVHLGGTSMACPHVVGVGALLKKAHPEYSVYQLMSAMRSGGIPLGLSGMGSGLIDAPSVVNGTTPPSAPAPPNWHYECVGKRIDGKCNKITGSGNDLCWGHYRCTNRPKYCGKSIFDGRPLCKDSFQGPYIDFEECNFYCEGKGYVCNPNYPSQGPPCLSSSTNPVYVHWTDCLNACGGCMPIKCNFSASI